MGNLKNPSPASPLPLAGTDASAVAADVATNSLLVFVPNSLTVGRLIAALCFPFVSPGWWLAWLLFGGISDLIDGWISRLLGVTSRFGQLLDPIADKAFVLGAIATLIAHGRLGWAELALVGARDIAVLALTIVVLTLDRSRLSEMRPRLSGKVATAGQFLFLLATVLWADRSSGWLWFAGGLSLYAAIDYLWVGGVALIHWQAQPSRQRSR